MKKRLEISLHTQKYYGISCLFLSLWTIWIFAFTGLQVYHGRAVGRRIFGMREDD